MPEPRLVDGLIVQARESCACYACKGPREIGGHTIAMPDNPRETPSSCVANTLLRFWLETMRSDAEPAPG